MENNLYLLIISTLILFQFSCGSNLNSGQPNDGLRQQESISLLPLIELPLKAQLNSNDNLKFTPKDSLPPFFAQPTEILGILPDTSLYYGFVTYVRGADYTVLSLKTFEKAGKQISSTQISFARCGSGGREWCLDSLRISKDLEIINHVSGKSLGINADGEMDNSGEEFEKSQSWKVLESGAVIPISE